MRLVCRRTNEALQAGELQTRMTRVPASTELLSITFEFT